MLFAGLREQGGVCMGTWPYEGRRQWYLWVLHLEVATELLAATFGSSRPVLSPCNGLHGLAATRAPCTRAHVPMPQPRFCNQHHQDESGNLCLRLTPLHDCS